MIETGPDNSDSGRALPSASSGGSAHGERLAWADLAKGACIVLVVLWHVVTKTCANIDWTGHREIVGGWAHAVAFATPIRMPLFFLVSGILAASAIGRSWRTLARTKIGTFASLYLIWVLIQTAVFALTPGFETARATSWGALVMELTISPTNLWYLMALAIYFALAKLTTHVPTTLVLLLAAALSVTAAGGWLPSDGNRWQVLQNAVFFLAGLRLRDPIRGWAERQSPLSVVGWACAYLAVWVAAAAAGQVGLPGVGLLLSTLGLLAGVSSCAVLSRSPRAVVGRLSRLGRRTLPIYVIHLPVLALLTDAATGAFVPFVPSGSVAAALAPPLLTAVVIAVSLRIERGLVAIHLGRLFTPLARRR